MSMPKFDETFLPILQVLADGQIHKFSELPQTLLDKGYFQLTPEELHETVSDGSGLYYGRVGWGVTYLKQAKLVERPTRGYVQITPKGLALVQTGITQYRLADMKHDADFSAHEPKHTTASVAAAGTVSLDLRLTTPTTSSVFTQQSVDVTLQAVAL